MRNVDKVDLLSGLLVLLVGAYFAIGALEYRMGTITRMGPGFVPFWIGIIAAFLGLVIVFTALGRSGDLPPFAPRAAGSILLAILIFALVLPRFGLVAAAFVTALVAMAGNPKARPVGMLVTAAVITLVCWGIFVAALDLPIPAWRTPF